VTVILLALLGCPAPSPETGILPADSGTALLPAVLSVTPEALDFGALPRGCTAESQAVWVENTGEASLEVHSAEVDGSGSSAFTIELPAAIDGGESAALWVSFTPSALYDYTLPLTIKTSAGNTTITLSGSGVVGESITDQTTLALNERVDVLLLVDHTESMAEPLSAIDAGMHAFWSSLTAEGASVHLGVLTMDMEQSDHSGRLQRIITESDSAPTLPDPDSTATEQGLAALTAALSEPLISTDNSGFRREDALLSIIVFSDEDDDSNLDADGVTAWLLDLGGTLHAMVEARKPEQACQTEPGVHYLDLMDATGGRFASICTEDAEDALTGFARTILGISDTFPLSESPDSAEGITVTKNGETIPQSLTEGWTLDATDSTITLHGTTAPIIGDTLTFQYTATICP